MRRRPRPLSLSYLRAHGTVTEQPLCLLVANLSDGRNHVVASDLGHVVSIFQAFLVGLRKFFHCRAAFLGLGLVDRRRRPTGVCASRVVGDELLGVLVSLAQGPGRHNGCAAATLLVHGCAAARPSLDCAVSSRPAALLQDCARVAVLLHCHCCTSILRAHSFAPSGCY